MHGWGISHSSPAMERGNRAVLVPYWANRRQVCRDRVRQIAGPENGFDADPANGGNRRILLGAACPGEGLLNELIAAPPETGPHLCWIRARLAPSAKRVVDLDAEIPDSAFELRVPE